jgi:iron complex outermembrane receptor protein
MNCKLKIIPYVVALAMTSITAVAAEDSDVPSADPEIEKIVIVSATRRAENVQSVPISLTVVDGDYMARSGINNLKDLSTHVPNFNMSNSSQVTNTRLIIRGVGSVGNTAVEGSVGVFIDGVYYPRPGSVIGNLLDISAVEVLRGPQGTLFGRNTPMGALNITTNDPTDDFRANTHVSYGNYNDLNIGTTISGGLSDSIYGLASVNYTDRDGYGYNELTNKEIGEAEDLTFRGKLLFDISDSFEAKLTVDLAEVNHTGAIVELLPETNSPLFIGTTQALYGVPAGSGDDPYDNVVNQVNDDKATDEQWGVTVQLKYDIADYELKSITAIRNWENDYQDESSLRIAADLVPRNSFYSNGTFSQEFQILSPEGDHFDYVAGLFYYKEDFDVDTFFDAGSDYCSPTIFGIVRGQLIASGMDPATAMATALGQANACGGFAQDKFVTSEFRQELESLAIFAQGTFHINDRLDTTFGARWTNDEKTGSFEQQLNNPFAAIFRSPESTPDLKVDESKVTWLANVRYQFNDDVMGFFTASTGFKSGGFNSQGTLVALGDRRTFANETTENLEVGIKSSFFDKALTANVTLYQTDIKDFQSRSFDGLSFVTTNAGELRQRGVEIDFKYTATDNVNFSGGLGTLDSEFLSYPNGSGLPGGAVQDLTGTANHWSPKLQANLTADWNIPLSTNLSLFVRPAISYVDNQNIGGTTNQNPQTIQPSYSLASLRVGIEDFGAGWRLTAFVDNLTDKGYCSTMFDQPLGGSLGAVNATNNTTAIRCVVGAPRTYGLTFSYQY